MTEARRKLKTSATLTCRVCGHEFARGAAGEGEGVCAPCFAQTTETSEPSVTLLFDSAAFYLPGLGGGAAGGGGPAGHSAVRQASPARESAVLRGGRERR